ILMLVRNTNVYMEHQAPWKEAKENLERAGTILYTATEALRISAVLLLPVMPSKANAVLEILGAVGTPPRWGQLKAGTKLQSHAALFPRLDAEGKVITKESK
ncbi:MAG: methionine--tRNA ligase, partial [Nitrospirota bacterium]